jgi:thymidylate synthase (FAD)
MFMNVRMIGYTKPIDIIGIDDVQDLIAYAARVSNPANQMNTATSEKLLGYLIREKHWSPFEMASVTMEVETTRDIARQFLRHRSFSFQEFSQRYANPQDMENSFVVRDARLQDTKNRQNSVDTEDKVLQSAWVAHQNSVIARAKEAYDWAIDNGIAKEQARAVLPEGNTVSRLYVNGTIRSWIHYIELRSGHGTQKEHIELAREIGKAINTIFPMSEQFIN